MFTITKDHLNLLKEMYTGWNDMEYGAPSIDPKRPYGSSYNVEQNIAEILGWKMFEDADEEKHLSKEQYELAQKLHQETEQVLQICLCTQSFEEGTYERKEDYHEKSWKKIK